MVAGQGQPAPFRLRGMVPQKRAQIAKAPREVISPADRRQGVYSEQQVLWPDREDPGKLGMGFVHPADGIQSATPHDREARILRWRKTVDQRRGLPEEDFRV